MAEAPKAQADWTEATTAYWQALVPLEAWTAPLQPPYRHGLPVVIARRHVLVLPIRRLPLQAGQTAQALASLIANQASMDVVDSLAREMGALAAALQPSFVVGLPTLGMAFAPGVARALGHTRWVPMGYSRKFWYTEELSTMVRSITTPGQGKAIYLDPNQLPLVQGQRVVIVDDVVSSAQTLASVWDLLQHLGADVAGAVVAMRQGERWRRHLGAERSAHVLGVFDTPQLELHEDGWWPTST